MTDYSGDDYGREQDRHEQQPSGDWTAPGSTPEYPPSYGTDHGGDVPGQSQGYGGQAYGAGNGRYGDAVAPMGAAPSGAMTRVGPGGVPELWPGPIPLRPMQFGEIIETAFRVLRFNPKTFFGLTFVVLAVTMLVASLVTWAILAAVGGSADVFAVSENGDMPGGMLLQFASAAIGLVSAFLSGMLIVPIGESALGRRLGAGESWHRIKGRLLPLLGYMLLSGLISLVLIIPLVAAIPALWLLVHWTGAELRPVEYKSLSQALKVYADALRMRRRLRAEAIVGKAGIKMLFPVVLFILPALFVVTLVPGMLSFLRELKGGIGAKP